MRKALRTWSSAAVTLVVANRGISLEPAITAISVPVVSADQARDAHRESARVAVWSGVVNGVEFGWTSDHAWAIASYATVSRYGAGEVASLACDAVSDGGAGPVCDYIAEEVVASLAAGHPAFTNYGLWIAIYPLQNNRVAAGGY
jgi:hypothetical protein